MIVALVGCSGPKLAEPAPARDLYVSDLFRKARAYAERHADAWAVLSAKHGVVLSDQVIAPYDLSVRDLSCRIRGHVYSHGGGWSERGRWREHMHQQLHQLFPNATRYLFLAGDEYDCRYSYCAGARCCLPFEAPMEGLGIGERKKWLKRLSA